MNPLVLWSYYAWSTKQQKRQNRSQINGKLCRRPLWVATAVNGFNVSLKNWRVVHADKRNWTHATE